MIKHLKQPSPPAMQQAAAEQFRLVSKKLDQVASTSTMHKKTAARKKSRLAKKFNALKAKRHNRFTLETFLQNLQGRKSPDKGLSNR